LLALLADHKLDFHLTLRHLTRFRPSLLSSPDAFIDTLLRFTSTGDVPERDETSKQWKDWLEKYAARIESEKEEWVGASSGGDWQALREKDARLANPRFVLRQWVLEEVIAKVEADARNGRHVLAKVMQVSFRCTSVLWHRNSRSPFFFYKTQMACNPYDPWGGEDDERTDNELDAEAREERRLCGIGDTKMLGFQCSCSS
jgi:uncharacterized protein YdiU (UPF0061 family)